VGRWRGSTGEEGGRGKEEKEEGNEKEGEARGRDLPDQCEIASYAPDIFRNVRMADAVGANKTITSVQAKSMVIQQLAQLGLFIKPM